MANRPAPALVLRDGDREELERRTRSDRFGASAAKRARIVLLAAEGVANTRIAELTDATVTYGKNQTTCAAQDDIAILIHLEDWGQAQAAATIAAKAMTAYDKSNLVVIVVAGHCASCPA